MRTAYVAIVGMREINLAGKTLPYILNANANGGEPKTIRQFSQEILDEYPTYREEITAPILEPGIRQVLESLGEGGRIDSLLLFVTDQQDPKHRQSDTLHIGAILERRLPELFGKRIAKIESCSISDDPSSYDKMYAVFARELRKFIEPRDYDRVWAAPVGGPPACTNGLILNVVDLYGENSRLIFVAENGIARTLDLQQTILQRFAKEQARAFLSRRDFGALRTTMERAGLGERWSWHLCSYAERRLHFDFKGADEALQEADKQIYDPSHRINIAKWRQSLRDLMKTVTPADSSCTLAQWKEWLLLQSENIAELYFNLRHKAERGEWVDFLGRLFRLHEASLRLMFERKMKHSCENTKYYRDFYKGIDADPLLAAEFKPDPKKKGRRPSVDTTLLMRWLELEAKRDQATYQVQCDRTDLVNKLKTIRNRSIMAHGYQGISKPEIERELGGRVIYDFIDGDMRDYLAHPQIGANVAQNNDPLADVITLLQKALEA